MATCVNNQITNLKPSDSTSFSNWQFRIQLILEQLIRHQMVMNLYNFKNLITTHVQLQKKKYKEGTHLNIFLREFEQTIHELKSAD